MKKTKLFAFFIAVVTGAALLLAACGGGGSQPAATTAAAAAEEVVTEAATAVPEATEAAVAATDAAEAVTEVAETTAAAAAAADMPAVEFSYNTPFASTHPFSVIDTDWMNKLKEQANITVTPYWSNSLVSPVTPYQEILDGVADSTQVIPGAESDHFYLANAIQAFVAYGTQTPRVVYETVCSLYNDFPELMEEYAGVVPFSVKNNGEPVCFITKNPVRSLDDLKGMAIRSANDEDFAILTELGANPIRLQVPELMESLEKGVIDGVILPKESLASMNFAEICPYCTEVKMVSAFSIQKFISEETYNKFTPEQQQIFDAVSKETDYQQIEDAVASDEAGIKAGEANNVEFIEMSDADYQKLEEMYAAYAESIRDKLDSEGYNGTAIFNAARDYMEKYEAEFGR